MENLLTGLVLDFFGGRRPALDCRKSRHDSKDHQRGNFLRTMSGGMGKGRGAKVLKRVHASLSQDVLLLVQFFNGVPYPYPVRIE